MSARKYTVAVDFDGVLHSYVSPWVNAHTIPDPPVDGALLWLRGILQDFNVVIFSTRCKTWRGRRAVRNWIYQNAKAYWYESGAPSDYGLESITLSYEKPPALIYLDDRAYRFHGPGTFPTRQQIHDARPWNKP
jgi:hypothetical protein